MLIVYKDSMTHDVIITTPENESATVKEYFTEGERDIDDWDRDVVTDRALHITPTVRVDW